MFGEKAKHLAASKKRRKIRTDTGIAVRIYLHNSRVVQCFSMVSTHGEIDVAFSPGKEKAAKSTKHLVSRRKAKKATSSGETQLHPSWEARRRKKAMETGIHHFQGQKTVFSD